MFQTLAVIFTLFLGSFAVADTVVVRDAFVSEDSTGVMVATGPGFSFTLDPRPFAPFSPEVSLTLPNGIQTHWLPWGDGLSLTGMLDGMGWPDRRFRVGYVLQGNDLVGQEVLVRMDNLRDIGPYGWPEEHLADFTFFISPNPYNLADRDRSGHVDTNDLYLFLNDYFTGRPSADFDFSGVVSTQDIFSFLDFYYAL